MLEAAAVAYTRYSMVVTETGRYMAQSERSAPGLSLKSVVIMAVRDFVALVLDLASRKLS